METYPDPELPATNPGSANIIHIHWYLNFHARLSSGHERWWVIKGAHTLAYTPVGNAFICENTKIPDKFKPGTNQRYYITEPLQPYQYMYVQEHLIYNTTDIRWTRSAGELYHGQFSYLPQHNFTTSMAQVPGGGYQILIHPKTQNVPLLGHW